MKTNPAEFDAIKISLASPEQIREWSYGEVTKAETINYRTFKPEKDGLFDERIFGPTKDLECYCGKYKRQRYKGVVCEKCGVEVTFSRVRRERMGHIELAAPVVHTWYFRRTPSKLPLILDIGLRDVESIIYFAQHLVTQVDQEKRKEILTRLEQELREKKTTLEETTNTEIKELEQKLEKQLEPWDKKEKLAESDELKIENLKKQNRREILYLRERLIKDQDQLEESFNQVTNAIKAIKPLSVISENEMTQFEFWGAAEFFKAGKGAETILEALENLDIEQEITELYEVIRGKSKVRRQKAIKRLKIMKGLKDAGINPSWSILQVLPVIPPELRPIVQLPGGRFATSDLNDLYRRVINRNNRLRDLIQLGAPDIILQNEKRMLQESVDSLIESAKKITRGRKELQSLTEMLKGKQGRFRQNLLGKRVDYSGRSVIVVGPDLRIDQVGIPKEMALELFKPFVLRDLILENYAPNLKSAKNVLESRGPEVWDILERVTKDHPVLLNRAPTLHRQNIQAFYPVLIEGKAISFHPSVVGSFAGDFDGDQMAIHVPLSEEALEEARVRLLTPHNLLKLSHGQPIVDLKYELSLGLYYLTEIEDQDTKTARAYTSEEQALSAYENGSIDLHTAVKILYNQEQITTTPGRIIFNSLMPEKLRFVNEIVDRDVMRKLMASCFDEFGEKETSKMLDRFKEYGQHFATQAGISYSMFDFHIPSEREKIIEQTYKKIDEIEQNYRLGLLTPRERHLQIITVWEQTQNEISDVVIDQLDPDSIISMILKSKATKANPETIRQVQGMRGLMVDSQGLIKETPIKTTFLEGHTAFEGFLNMIGGRKSLIDVALLTADAGYLTRRLVDVAHDVLTREVDCVTDQGIYIREESGVDDWLLEKRIEGRTAWKDIKNPDGEILVKKGELISQQVAEKIIEAGIVEVPIRSVFTCQTPHGVCSKCYGKDLATRKLVEVGEAVGIIAAQSIGEPGTQLTLHSKHRAGVAKKEITQGLPRIEELFEARTPKQTAVLSDITGKVSEITENDEETVVIITPEKSSGDKDTHTYTIPISQELNVKKGELINAGDKLTKGHSHLDEILKIKGILAVQKYLLKEIQTVYKSQGVEINDKHIEVIVRKMSEKIRIKQSQDSSFLPGEYVNIHEFRVENQELEKEGKQPAKGSRALLGISKRALLTDSWLSAASFEETANVLAAAALNERPQMDYLLGLKENVIIGKLIPTGERARIKEMPHK